MSEPKSTVDFMRQALSAVNLIEEPVSYQDYVNKKAHDVEEGRVKDWLLDMEADAAEMSKEEFIKAHGEKHADIWDRVQKELKYGTDESVEEDDDEYDQPASRPEAEMVDNQIAFIKYAVDEIEDNVKAGGEFPEWFQNKLSGVHEIIKMLHAYMEGERRSDDQGEEVEEKAQSPYAIGMAKAMKMYKDKPPLSKKTIKKGHDIAKSIMGESTMTDNNKKTLNEGIRIQTDSLEDSIALMTILKNAGLDPQQMNIQQSPSMNAPAPEMPAPDMDANLPAEVPGEEPEAEAFDNQPDEKYLDKDDYELKRNKVSNKDMGPASATHGDNPLGEEEEEVEEAKNSKPDYLDFDKDGDKKEPMKKALKDKEKVKEEIDAIAEQLNKEYQLFKKQ